MVSTRRCDRSDGRPATAMIAQDHLELLDSGRVRVGLRHPWSEGTTHLDFTPRRAHRPPRRVRPAPPRQPRTLSRRRAVSSRVARVALEPDGLSGAGGAPRPTDWARRRERHQGGTCQLAGPCGHRLSGACARGGRKDCGLTRDHRGLPDSHAARCSANEGRYILGRSGSTGHAHAPDPQAGADHPNGLARGPARCCSASTNAEPFARCGPFTPIRIRRVPTDREITPALRPARPSPRARAAPREDRDG